MDMREKQLLPVKRYTMRHADVAHVAAWASGLDGLHHRLLSANALEHRISPDALRQLLDALDTLVATLGDDVGRAELARELSDATRAGSSR